MDGDFIEELLISYQAEDDHRRDEERRRDRKAGRGRRR